MRVDSTVIAQILLFLLLLIALWAGGCASEGGWNPVIPDYDVQHGPGVPQVRERMPWEPVPVYVVPTNVRRHR